MHRECLALWERLDVWVPEIRDDVEEHLNGESQGDAHEEWTLRGAIDFAMRAFQDLMNHTDHMQINRWENDLMDRIL